MRYFTQISKIRRFDPIIVDFFVINVNVANILTDYETGIYHFLTNKLYRLFLENEKCLIIKCDDFRYPTFRVIGGKFFEDNGIKEYKTNNYVLFYANLEEDKLKELKNKIDLLKNTLTKNKQIA